MRTSYSIWLLVLFSVALETAGGRTRAAELRAATPSATESFLTAFTFAEMSDGVQIALAIGFPRGVERDAMQPIWPAMFEIGRAHV